MSRESLDDLRKKLGLEAQAHQAAVDTVDAAAAAYLQVNRIDLRCLEILTQSDSVLPSQLAVQLGLTTGSVTAMLDRVERLGYTTRSADPADRRKVVIRITPKATRKATKIYGPIALDGERDVLSRYSAAEIQTHASRAPDVHLIPASSSICDCAQGLAARRSRPLRTTQARPPAWLGLPATPTRSRSLGELPTADTRPSSSART